MQRRSLADCCISTQRNGRCYVIFIEFKILNVLHIGITVRQQHNVFTIPVPYYLTNMLHALQYRNETTPDKVHYPLYQYVLFFCIHKLRWQIKSLNFINYLAIANCLLFSGTRTVLTREMKVEKYRNIWASIDSFDTSFFPFHLH